MTTYADYTFYTTAYGGSLLSDGQFRPFAAKASCYIDTITYGRLCGGCDVPEAVKFAVCAVADEMYKQEQKEASRGVSTHNSDGVSISYVTETDKQLKQRVHDAAGLFLPLSHPLRYAGV